MAISTTGTVVTHRHDSPSLAGHGYGALALATPGDSVPASAPHRHFVLAGVEFGAVPDSGDSTQSGEPQCRAVLKACHTLADPAVVDPPPALPLPPLVAPLCGSLAPFSPVPASRQDRSGVLLS